MKKTWIIVGAVVVAVVVGYLAMRNPGGAAKNTQGAIGAANRYQSEQISNQDVTLDDAQVASFIQTDTFHKLATDQQFREAARDVDFGRLVSSNLREVSAHVDLGKLLANKSVAELLSADAYKTGVTTGALKEGLLKTDFLTTTDNAHLVSLLHTAGLDQLATNADFIHLASDYSRWLEGARIDAARIDAGKVDAGKVDANKIDANKIDANKIDAGRIDAGRVLPSEQLAITEFNKLLDNYGSLKTMDGIRHLEKNSHFGDALSKGFTELFSTQDLASYSVASDGLRDLLSNKGFVEALRMDGFREFTGALNGSTLDAARSVADKPEMLSVLSNENYREAAMHAEFGMVAQAGLDNAVQKVAE